MWQYLRTKTKTSKWNFRYQDMKIQTSDVTISFQISRYHFRYHAQTFPVRSWSVRFDRLTVMFSRETLHIFFFVSRFHTKKSQMLILCIRNSFWLHNFIDLHFFEKDVAMTSKCWTTNALKIFIVLLKGFEKSIITRAQSKFKQLDEVIIKSVVLFIQKKTLQSPCSDMQKRRRTGYQPRCARGLFECKMAGACSHIFT